MPRPHPSPRRARQTLLVAVALGACDSHAPPPSKGAPAPTAARPAPPKAAPVEDDGLATVRNVAVTLHHAATRRGPIALHRLSDGEIVATGGVTLARVGADGDLTQETSWLAGLAHVDPAVGAEVYALGGQDDALWLTVRRGGDEPSFRVYRWRERAWAPHEPDPEAPGSYYADYTTWPNGHAIALRVGPQGERALVVLDDDGARLGRPKLEVAGLAASPRPSTIAGLATGELFAAVSAAEGLSSPGVLRWGPDDGAGLFAPLPGLESRAPRQIAALVESGGQVLIGDGVEIDEAMVPYVARFDGTSWRLLDPPPARGSVVALAEGADLTWVVVDEDGPKDSLWRIHSGGDWDMWERVELAAVQPSAGAWFWDAEAATWAAEPAAPSAYAPSPRGLALDASGELWVSAQLLLADGTPSPYYALLRSGEDTTPLALPDDGQILAAQQDLQPRRSPRAGDPTCPQVYVQLYTVAEEGPEVGTAELREAMTGPLAPLLLGEVRSQGERQVGLLLTASEYEVHKAAIAGLASKLRYRTRASCGHPPLLRGWRASG
jgi:hypothetical protein